jgi:DNA-binding NarL/FixJ family response regulator
MKTLLALAAALALLMPASVHANKAIAERLGVTVAAVKWHLQHIYEKLHVHSRTEAALKFKQGQGA